jgi:N6-adenosine-specific RNA methylase IME4
MSELTIDGKTGEVVPTTDAYQRHEKIKELRDLAVATFLDLGKELYYFERDKQYLELDHPTFESYLADPDVDISRRMAFRMKGIYAKYTLELEVTTLSLLRAGYSKLDIIRPYIDKTNVDSWINKAETLSYKDIQLEIRREQHQNGPQEPLGGKYRVLYVDPPWKYRSSGQGLDYYGPAERHYPCMSIDEMCALPIQDITEANAVMFIWVTSPMLEDSFRVINAWGFKYKASYIWDKIGHNYGHYNSVRHEFLLVCTKGSCLPDESALYDSVQSHHKSRKHSEKPEEFRKIIDNLYTWGNKIELFARKEVNGWEAWGNESR